jgi:tetratricopeptide (TPR) repeat protein
VIAASRTHAARLLLRIAETQLADGLAPAAEESLRAALALEPEPEAAFALGRLLLRRRAKDDADAVFASLLDWSGGRAELRVLVGGAYADAGYLNDAIREFKAALAGAPDLQAAHVSLGYAYLALAAGQSNPDAERALRRALELDPASYNARYYLGQLELLAGRRREASEHLRAAAAARPRSPEPWLQLGLDAFARGEPGPAEADLRKGLELAAEEPGRSEDLLRRASAALSRIALARGDRAEAERWFRRAREVAAGGGEPPPGVARRGGAAAAGGAGIATPAAALAGTPGLGPPGAPPPPAAAPSGPATAEPPAPADLRRALGDRLAAVYNDWGTAEARRGDFHEALRRYRNAEPWRPDAPGLMRNLGLAAIQAGDYAEGARALARALEADPDDRAVRALLAIALASSDRYAEAVEVFATIGDAAFADPRLAYLWALSLARSERPDEARRVLARLRALPLPPEALAQVAALYEEIGDPETAAGLLEEAARRRP